MKIKRKTIGAESTDAKEPDKRSCESKQLSVHSYRKGQLFIIASVFIIAGLVLIFGVLSSPIIVEEKNFQDIRSIDKNARNVLAEYKYAAGAATLNSPANQSLAAYMSNLSDYYRNEMDIKVLYAAAMSNGTDQRLSVSVGNYLRGQINVTINATQAAPGGISFVLADKTHRSIDFTANSNVTVVVNLSYSIGGNTVSEWLLVNSSSRNFMALFSDVEVSDGTYTIRAKDVYNRTW